MPQTTPAPPEALFHHVASAHRSTGLEQALHIQRAKACFAALLDRLDAMLLPNMPGYRVYIARDRLTVSPLDDCEESRIKIQFALATLYPDLIEPPDLEHPTPFPHSVFGTTIWVPIIHYPWHPILSAVLFAEPAPSTSVLTRTRKTP